MQAGETRDAAARGEFGTIRSFPGADPSRAGGDPQPAFSRNPSLDAAFASVARARRDFAAAAEPARPAPEGASDALATSVSTTAAALAVRLDAGLSALTALVGRLTAEVAALSPAATGDATGPLADTLARLTEIVATAEDESRRLAADLADSRARLAEAAVLLVGSDEDSLPAVGSTRIEHAIIRAARSSDRTAVLLIGLDHLGTLDARHGEGTSADVLAAGYRAIATGFADLGSVHRLREDVFAVVLTDSPLRQAVAVGEHLRRTVIRKTLVRRSSGNELGRLSLSIGAAAFRRTDTPASLLARADACLGEAEWAGGNRLICEIDPGAETSPRRLRA